MLIGHYGAAFALKKAAPKASLGTFFLAAQLPDLICLPLMLLGVERAVVQPGGKGIASVSFEHYPFTHSFLATAALAVLFALVYKTVRKDFRTALVLGCAVLSHWFLDVAVHRADLPWYPGGPLAGTGLLDYPGWTLLAELALFGAGLVLYGRFAWGLAAVLLLLQVGALWGPTPPVNGLGLVLWGVVQWLLVFWAYRLDRDGAATVENVVPRLEFFLQSLVLRQNKCPHCDSAKNRLVARKYLFIGVKRCESCGLYFTSPIYKTRLSADLYGGIYESGFVTRLPKPDQLAEWKKTGFQRTERDDSRRLRGLAELCGPDGKTLLEIGCSWGYFLYQADRHGFQSTGLEVDAARARFGAEHLGVRIVSGFTELKGRQFDVVYAAHVLEHVAELSGLLKNISLHLKRGGRLIAEVPNFDYERLGKKKLSLIGAVHPLGFDSDFFARNLPAYGFQVRGLYDSWENFPERPAGLSSGDFIIVSAEKI
jgi:SAM-dependent methyltransferase